MAADFTAALLLRKEDIHNNKPCNSRIRRKNIIKLISMSCHGFRVKKQYDLWCLIFWYMMISHKC